MANSLLYPKHPERICWGCEKYCPANHLNCRETRVEHPVELFGGDWCEASDAIPRFGDIVTLSGQEAQAESRAVSSDVFRRLPLEEIDALREAIPVIE